MTRGPWLSQGMARKWLHKSQDQFIMFVILIVEHLSSIYPSVKHFLFQENCFDHIVVMCMQTNMAANCNLTQSAFCANCMYAEDTPIFTKII